MSNPAASDPFLAWLRLLFADVDKTNQGLSLTDIGQYALEDPNGAKLRPPKLKLWVEKFRDDLVLFKSGHTDYVKLKRKTSIAQPSPAVLPRPTQAVVGNGSQTPQQHAPFHLSQLNGSNVAIAVGVNGSPAVKPNVTANPIPKPSAENSLTFNAPVAPRILAFAPDSHLPTLGAPLPLQAATVEQLFREPSSKLAGNGNFFHLVSAWAPERSLHIDYLDSLLDVLPEPVAAAIQQHSGDMDPLITHIFMDLGQSVRVVKSHDFTGETKGSEVLMCPYADQTEGRYLATLTDLNKVVSALASSSISNRSGINGTFTSVSIIHDDDFDPIGLTIKIGRPIPFLLHAIQDLAVGQQSILVFGRPGVGKTSLLREFARFVSDEKKSRVIIVDNYNEIGGWGPSVHESAGASRRIRPTERNTGSAHSAILSAIHSHTPEVIIIDELSTLQDAEAVIAATRRGIRVIAGTTAKSLRALLDNPQTAPLLGGFHAGPVYLGDVSKKLAQRTHEPPFQCAVELSTQTSWLVHPSLTGSVDGLLSSLVVNGGGALQVSATPSTVLPMAQRRERVRCWLDELLGVFEYVSIVKELIPLA